MFSERFIAAGRDYTDWNHDVPAPYLRRSFTLDTLPRKAMITVCGLGFYDLSVNGQRITKGLLAPYISNPDDILYYDEYDLTELLVQGENVIGLVLGNGMLNCPGGQIWDFQKARYRSAPKAALALEADLGSGMALLFEADERFRTAPSPILFDDLRAGEYYDARREQPGWDCPGFDDSAWTPAVAAETPRGVCRVPDCEPIITQEELSPVAVRPGRISHFTGDDARLPHVEPSPIEAEREGILFDFGVNAAGLCRLKVKARPGQAILMQFGEYLDANGEMDLRPMSFLPAARDHRDLYIAKGEGVEEYMPRFTYHGFRYCLVVGLDPDQVTDDVLTYCVMNSDIASVGGFACSDETLNRLQEATRVADLANFYYFPTDCPHREKNGWTADAALSAEQLLMNFSAARSYREWMHNIRRAQREDGALPGIIPTAGWGFRWGNGPAWDCVLAYLPFFTWRFTGHTDLITDNAHALVSYLEYLTRRRDSRGLLAIGLGDWLQPGHPGDKPSSPLVFTDTVIAYDIANKCSVMFGAANLKAQQVFAETVANELLAAARRHLIDHDACVALGACQSSQAMALFYGIFTAEEEVRAYTKLLEYIHAADDHLDVGVLGGRVLFRVLTDHGDADLAHFMITRKDHPSYGSWVENGATALWENFRRSEDMPASMNHHFWGDISAWMMEAVGGLNVNPALRNANEVLIRPRFVKALSHAEVWHELNAGRVSVHWAREGESILLEAAVPEGVSGSIAADDGWQFEDGSRQKTAESGLWKLIPYTDSLKGTRA